MLGIIVGGDKILRLHFKGPCVLGIRDLVFIGKVIRVLEFALKYTRKKLVGE